MKKWMICFAAVLFFAGLATQCTLAQSGSVGCGGGNGAPVACNADGLSGTVTMPTGISVSSTGIAVNITGTSDLPSEVAGFDDFTPNSEVFDFSFSNVGFAFSDGGTFSLTDESDGDLSVSGTAELGSTPSLFGNMVILLNVTNVSLGSGSDDDGFVISLSGITGVGGVVNLTVDPGTVTSANGTMGLPIPSGGTGGGSGPGPTPEPGTLLLLGSGVIGIGAFMRRRML